jgi:hypothetical protein
LFGSVKAGNITGDLISGKTMQSADRWKLEPGTICANYKEDGEFDGFTEADKETWGPAWQIRRTGDGYLAGGKISWDTNGVVYKDLSIKFEDIEGADKVIGNLIDEVLNKSLSIKELIKRWGDDGLLSPSELEELIKLKSELIAEHDRIISTVADLDKRLASIKIVVPEVKTFED